MPPRMLRDATDTCASRSLQLSFWPHFLQRSFDTLTLARSNVTVAYLLDAPNGCAINAAAWKNAAFAARVSCADVGGERYVFPESSRRRDGGRIHGSATTRAPSSFVRA